jgi:hypothetical protein
MQIAVRQDNAMQIAGRQIDTDTVMMLRRILDEVWDDMDEIARNNVPRSLLAERMLTAAARGERNPKRLKAVARA